MIWNIQFLNKDFVKVAVMKRNYNCAPSMGITLKRGFTLYSISAITVDVDCSEFYITASEQERL